MSDVFDTDFECESPSVDSDTWEYENSAAQSYPAKDDVIDELPR